MQKLSSGYSARLIQLFPLQNFAGPSCYHDYHAENDYEDNYDHDENDEDDDEIVESGKNVLGTLCLLKSSQTSQGFYNKSCCCHHHHHHQDTHCYHHHHHHHENENDNHHELRDLAHSIVPLVQLHFAENVCKVFSL